MATAAKRWTVEELRALPDDGKRHEIIDGALWMTPAPSWEHQDIVLALARLLADYVDPHAIGRVLIAPADVVFDRHTSVQPDVFVVPLVNGRRPRSFAEAGGLLLTVEVLSPATARFDRGDKRELYQTHGVAQYWIVDPDARLVERWAPGNDHPEIIDALLVWHPDPSHDAFTLDLPTFFARVLGDSRGTATHSR